MPCGRIVYIFKYNNKGLGSSFFFWFLRVFFGAIPTNKILRCGMTHTYNIIMFVFIIGLSTLGIGLSRV